MSISVARSQCFQTLVLSRSLRSLATRPQSIPSYQARAMSSSKKQRTLPSFELLYHPGIPGRGEYIRLPLEATGTPYSDPANEKKSGYDAVQTAMDPKADGDGEGNPIAFAPPMLRVPGAGKDGKGPLLIHQTPTILAYLGPLIGMAGEDDVDALHVSQIAQTALDLSNETHDTHHPVAVAQYYEEQKEESVKKAADVRTNRIPKYFSYFERILKGNEAQGKGQYLVSSKLTYADTTVWQVLDGLYFAFPKELEAREKEFKLLLGTFYPAMKNEGGLKDYLSSERRLPFSMGLFRHYPELDRQ